MDGSEPGDVTPAAVLSGAPVEIQARTVRYAHPFVDRFHLFSQDKPIESPEIFFNSIIPYVADAMQAFFVQQKQLPNLAHGTATNGEWIGTSFRRVTAGKTHLWAGSPVPISCKGRI